MTFVYRNSEIRIEYIHEAELNIYYICIHIGNENFSEFRKIKYTKGTIIFDRSEIEI